jgi:protein-histidine pros-kinase
VALLIILLLLNVVINWVINPIVQMARLLDQLANGQSVAEEIKLSYNDEIGEMNYNFLKLVKALEEKDIAEKALMRARDSAEDSRHKLQVLNRELEQRVEQRTASLAEEIEDRKAAQEALLESEASYKNLVQNSFQGLVIFDENGILFTNHRLSEIFGRSAQELDGMSIDRFYHLHHPDEAYLVRSKLDQLKQDPNFVRQYLYRILKKNGDVRWVEDYTSSINYQGKPAVQVVLLDVNERKLIEKDLAHYRNFLRRIIDNTPNLIFVKDLEGKFVQANITAAQHFGFSVEALQGKTEDELGVQLFGQHTHEYDQLVAKELKIQKLPITTITTPDGHKQHYELVKIPLLQSNGICNNILTVATDITQRLHAEERAKRAATTIRTMFNSIHDAIILHNTQHEIIDANAKIEELFGLRRDEVLGMHIFAFLSPRMSHARIEKTLRNLGLHASRVFEIRARHPKTKEFFDTEVYISKIEIDEQAYFITSIRNITERKQFQSALERSKSQAQEAIVQKGETLLHISTELRNPIRKSLALLEEEPTTQNNAQLHKYINQINTIITDIRKIAHIEQKAKYPTPMPVVVSDFLQQISNGYQHIAQTQNISWESNTNQKLPTAVLIDEQLLQNLLDRIVQQIIETGTITKIESQVHTQNIQTKPTRIHIHIHIRTHHKPESSIRLSDSKLFLHYCQTITKLLGGNFTSEISPDNTESLHIELNSIVTALDNATQAQLDTLVFEPATILITDDHEQNRHILFELLKDKRFRILTAANGRETLEICQTYSPDLILLDTYMPHMDGFQTQDLIKSNPQTAHIKTVAMTTSVSGSEMLKIEAYRFDAILRKPIHEKELKAILARFFTHT